MLTTVHQLYFLPWLGYFSKLYYSDTFVIFDTADFRKRHFYDRVKIIGTNGQPNYISLPTGQNYKMQCNKVLIKDSNNQFRDRIMRTLEESYAKAKFYDQEWLELKSLISKTIYSSYSLVQINFQLIKDIFEYLDLNLKNIIFTSDLELEYNDATEMLIHICEILNIDCLLLGDGKSTEIHDLERIRKSNIKIYFQEYKSLHPVYQQIRRKRDGFVPCMSVVDTILNVGKERTKEFITSNKYKPKVYKYK